MKKESIILAACIFLGIQGLCPAASEEERIRELEKKIEALQSAYEGRIRTLEGRIDELERGQSAPRENIAVQNTPPTQPTPSDTATAASSSAGSLLPVPDTYSIEWMEKYAAQVEALKAQQAAIAKKENDMPQLEFHGYLRSGFGINSYGNAMSPFQAPNSGAKYRLGNEAETYVETTFLTHMPKSMLPEGVTFDTQIRLAYVVPHDQSNTSSTETSLREAFGIARGVLSDMPEAAFWAGQRYYFRRDVHMNDFFYRDMSGYGGGIEDVPVGDEGAKFALAVLGGSSDKLDSSGTQFDDDTFHMNMNTVDSGVYDIAFGPGKLSFFGTFSDFNGDTFDQTNGDTVTLKSSEGVAGNLFYDFAWTRTVSDTFALQYGRGAAANFRALMVRPTGFIGAGDTIFNVSDLEKTRVLNSVLLDEGGPWTYEAVALYEEGDYGLQGSSMNRWVSGGIRPVYHFNRFFSLAFEAGADYTDNDRFGNGTLNKLTIAPQITPDAKHMSRPSLRTFLTYAWWADDFKGSAGGDDYADSLDGITVGVQLETWW